MKNFGNQDNGKGGLIKTILSKPQFNRNKLKLIVILAAGFSVFLTVIMSAMYMKVEQKVDVCVSKLGHYRNEVITEDSLEKYSMVKKEYENKFIVNKNGNLTNQVVKWEDRGKIIGAYVANTMMKGDYVQYKNLIGSVTDNSAVVLYSYPGKELTKLDINAADINTYKKMLSPGDKINVWVTYDDTLTLTLSTREDRGSTKQEETTRTEKVFTSIVLADILNNQGQSILDYLTKYNELSVTEQAKVQKTEEYEKMLKGSEVLVCLTPEEVQRLADYKSKDCTFFITLPQRGD